MEFRQLEYFIAVCDHKSFTRAAEKLFVSQPAITNAINNLENELGIKLFNRNKRFVELTPEGQTFYRHVSAVLSNVDQILLQMNQLKEQKSGVIKLAVNSLLAEDFFLPFYFRYRKENPSTRIIYHLSGNDQVRSLVERENCHLGLCVGAKNDFPPGSICLLPGVLKVLSGRRPDSRRTDGRRPDGRVDAVSPPILMNSSYSFTRQVMSLFKSQGEQDSFCFCDNLQATRALLECEGGRAYLPDFLCRFCGVGDSGNSDSSEDGRGPRDSDSSGDGRGPRDGDSSGDGRGPRDGGGFKSGGAPLLRVSPLPVEIEASVYLVKSENIYACANHFISDLLSYFEEVNRHEV